MSSRTEQETAATGTEHMRVDQAGKPGQQALLT